MAAENPGGLKLLAGFCSSGWMYSRAVLDADASLGNRTRLREETHRVRRSNLTQIFVFVLVNCDCVAWFKVLTVLIVYVYVLYSTFFIPEVKPAFR